MYMYKYHILLVPRVVFIYKFHCIYFLSGANNTLYVKSLYESVITFSQSGFCHSMKLLRSEQAYW